MLGLQVIYYDKAVMNEIYLEVCYVLCHQDTFVKVMLSRKLFAKYFATSPSNQ